MTDHTAMTTITPSQLEELAARHAWVFRNRHGDTGPTRAQLALLAFPFAGSIRATVHMSWAVWKRQHGAGLIDGTTDASFLTEAGRALRAHGEGNA
jgi:hypothetical protein